MDFSTAKTLFLLDRQAKGLTPKTILDYTKSLRKFETETGATTLEYCTRQNITNWVNTLGNLKPITANKYIRDIRAFLYYHMEEGDLPQYKVKLLRTQEEPLKFYTDDELERLMRKPSAEFVEYRTWVMVAIALGTGARIQTICSIQVEDIDWENGLLTYRHTKNKLTATVPISGQLLAILRKYTTIYSLTTGSLCPDVYGGTLTTSAAHQALEQYCTARGVARHSWHSFRHTFARHWLLNGGDIVRLQAMLQHSNISQTAHYAKVFGTDLAGTQQYTALEHIKTRQRRFK